MQEKGVEQRAKRGKNATKIMGARVEVRDVLVKFLKVKKVRRGKSRR